MAAAIDSTNAHQGEAGGRHQQLTDQVEVGQGDLGKAGRDGPDQGDAPAGQAGGHGEQDPKGDHEQRAGQRPRPPAAQPQWARFIPEG